MNIELFISSFMQCICLTGAQEHNLDVSVLSIIYHSVFNRYKDYEVELAKLLDIETWFGAKE